ncbi:uncharacterized protein LOC134430182 [Melospiza melodia melodia]|uniref:uncharacterized protein LOC134430182 n=1 Tax=Melospiza melodia melodia TaxID=1914991 RepID=UPI002FD36EAC
MLGAPRGVLEPLLLSGLSSAAGSLISPPSTADFHSQVKSELISSCCTKGDSLTLGLSPVPGCVWPAAALPRAPHTIPSWNRLPLRCCAQEEGKDRAVVPAVQPERRRGGHDAAARGALDGGGAGGGAQGQPAPGPPAPPAAAGAVHRQPRLRGLQRPLRALGPPALRQGGDGALGCSGACRVRWEALAAPAEKEGERDVFGFLALPKALRAAKASLV